MGWKCCEGDISPFRGDAICPMCGDTRYVTVSRFARRDDDPTKGDIRFCAGCSGGKLDALMRDRRVPPTITTRDLTQEEAMVVKEWRLQGHHELDCLRWIEGRRYDPSKDEEFLKDCEKALLKWRFVSKHDEGRP